MRAKVQSAVGNVSFSFVQKSVPGHLRYFSSQSLPRQRPVSHFPRDDTCVDDTLRQKHVLVFRKMLRKNQSDIASAMTHYSQLKKDMVTTASSVSNQFLPMKGYNELVFFLVRRLAEDKDISAFSTASQLILADMATCGLEPDGSTCLALMRGSIAAGELGAAKAYLERVLSLGRDDKVGLRVFAPMIEAAYQHQDLGLAVDMWRMLKLQGLMPSETEVAGLVDLILLQRDQHQRAPAKKGGEGTRESLLWAEAVDALFQLDLTASSRTISATAAARLENAFRRQEGGRLQDEANGESSSSGGILSFLKALFVNTREASPSTSSHASHCGSAATVNISSGSLQGGSVCPCCGGRLRVLGLSSEERVAMRRKLLRLSAATDVDDTRDLGEFGQWVEHRQPPFTVVVDGANVAYCNQNFAGGHFSFEQINLVVEALESEGETPLVVLPSCYADGKSVPNCTSGRAFGAGDIKNLRRQVSSEEDKLRRKWRGNKMLYSPRFQWAHDDWYWLYATVARNGSRQKKSQKSPFGQQLRRRGIGGGGGDGTTVCVVTNDIGRDHQQRLLPSRAFARWKDRHVRGFELSSACGVGKQDPVVTIARPPVCSREIQRTSNEKEVRWHIPIEAERKAGVANESDDMQWLCVSLPLSPSVSGKQHAPGDSNNSSSTNEEGCGVLTVLNALVSAGKRRISDEIGNVNEPIAVEK
mmetsp:Transcript_67913/g.136648  ORF Transcript_67913/g.136648 Transcript_67913/m.136648 type:complete len:701 (+) Transcript_67913:178-2280(+)